MKAWHAKVSNQHCSSCHRFQFTTKWSFFNQTISAIRFMVLDQCGHAWSLISSAKRHATKSLGWWKLGMLKCQTSMVPPITISIYHQVVIFQSNNFCNKIMVLDQCGHAWSLVSSAKRHFWWDMAITLTLELSCYKISWMMKAWHAKVSNQHGSSCHRFRFTTKSNETLPPPGRDWVGEKNEDSFYFFSPQESMAFWAHPLNSTSPMASRWVSPTKG